MRCKSLENKDLKHKKGLWSPDEDQKLIDYIMNHGLGCWSAVPINAGLQRNGKSCRLRWTNYLRPGLKRGMFTTHEEEIILTLHGMLGNKWSQMSQHLPGRSDNEIKNHWHSHLKKKFANVEKEKTQPTSLDTSNKESSYTSSLKSTRRDSSLESSRHMEGLSADPGLFDYPKQASRRIPPKILFADWLSPGQFHEYDNSGELSVSRDVFHCASSSQETIINGGSYTSIIQERSRASNLQLRSEHRHAERDMYDLIFEDNIYPNFDITDVKMYTCDDFYSVSTPRQSNTRSL